MRVHTSDPHIDAGWVKPRAAVTQRRTISYLLPITDHLGRRNGKPQRQRFARFAKISCGINLGARSMHGSVVANHFNFTHIHITLQTHALSLSFPLSLLPCQVYISNTFTYSISVFRLVFVHIMIWYECQMEITSRRWANRMAQQHRTSDCHHFCNIGIWFVFIFHTFALLLSLASTRCD